MSGFIKIVPPPHFCRVPDVLLPGIGIGSRWQCECGRVWKLKRCALVLHGLAWSRVRVLK